MDPVADGVDQDRKRVVSRITLPWNERVMIADPAGGFKNGDGAENDPRRRGGIPAEQELSACLVGEPRALRLRSAVTQHSRRLTSSPSKRANMP